MLVEFQSVTEALRCAVEFQEGMARRNRDVPASQVLLYRIGINLGDVIVEGDDIFGDGVNVAARLEAMAESGGICISAAVRDQVGDRIDVGYEDLGEQHVKNLDRAIRVFKVLLPGQAAAASVTAQAFVHGWCEDSAASVRLIAEELQTALSLDDNDADVHRVLAALNLNFNEHDKAVYHQERALSLNPNSDVIVVQQGELLTWLGRAEEGIEWIRRAMRLNPYHSQRFWNHLGRAQYTAHLYADAIGSFTKLTTPDHTHHAFLAASSAQLGNQVAAAAHAREVLQRQATFTVEGHLKTLHYRQPADAEHVREGLLKAGLPS